MQFTLARLSALAKAAEVDHRTLAYYLLGCPVRPATQARIDEVLQRHDLLDRVREGWLVLSGESCERGVRFAEAFDRKANAAHRRRERELRRKLSAPL